MSNFPRLYKTDSKGKTRIWQVEVIDKTYVSVIVVTHGELLGKQQVKETVINSGKNIGKANETSCLEQANLEAQSKWNKQIDKGYSLDGKSNNFLPMLAHKMKDHAHKIKYPCVVQPKLDGLRCFIYWDSNLKKPVAKSRKNKEWKAIPHIIQALHKFFEDNPNIILDGEIYCDPKVMDFQEILSAVKRDKPNDKSALAQFWCYDAYDMSNSDLSFGERWKLIPEKLVIKVDNTICESMIEIQNQQIHNTTVICVEGSMVRNIDSPYEIDKRSYNLLKLKDFDDDEFEIVGKKEDKNGECVFECWSKEANKSFECKPKGTNEERVQYLLDDNIGKMLNVRYFGLSQDKIPRFPVGIYIRY